MNRERIGRRRGRGERGERGERVRVSERVNVVHAHLSYRHIIHSCTMSGLACSKQTCVVLTYPEVFAGDGQEEEGKRDHNAEDDNDGEDKEYHVGCRKAGLTTEAAYLHRGIKVGWREGYRR